MVRRLPVLLGLVLAACAASQDRSPSLLELLKPTLEQPEGLLIRYNPVDCGCPHFELRSPEGWVRVRLLDDPDRPLVEQLSKEGEAALAQGQPAFFQLQAELANKTIQRCGGGVPFLELELGDDWPVDGQTPAPQGGPEVTP